jgi:tetratricopeptide (TPR) repeat protein
VNANEINVIGKQEVNKIILPPTPAERLPEKWRIPRKNPKFTGREKLLEQIKDHFSRDDIPVVLTTTHGLGGIGKTQLAIEFAWRNYQKYKGVVWFNSENRGRLLDDYISLGIKLNIVHASDRDTHIEEHALVVKDWLEEPKHAGWLLIYDNAPKYGGSDQEGIGDLFPTGGGKILVTSRYATGWPQRIKVEVFTPEESRAYIKKASGTEDLDTSQVNQLAETLGHLPLALAQACAYIEKSHIIIERYLELYEIKKKELLSDKILVDQTLPPDAHRAIVYITWDITMEAVRKESLLAYRLLTVCAYLNNNDIPNYLLKTFASSSENNPNQEIFEAALGTLSSYSILTVNMESSNASIHPLVQEVTRLKSKPEAEQLLDKLLGCHEYSSLHRYLSISSLDRNQILHLMQIWEHSFEYSNLVKGHSDMATDIFNKLLSLTLYRELLRFTKSIASALRHISGGRKRDTLWMEYCACLGLETNGEYEEALKQYKIVWEKQVKHVGQYDSHTLLTQEQIASTLCRMKKWEESLKKHQEVYSLMLKHLPKDHSHTRITQHNIAICLKEMGELDKALPIFQDVYDFRKKTYGATNSWTLDTRSHIADIWFQKMDFEKARLEYEEIYKVSKGLEGELHTNTIRSMEMLAKSLWELGRKQEGYRKLSEVVELYEKALGSKHPTTTMIQDLLSEWNSKLKWKWSFLIKYFILTTLPCILSCITILFLYSALYFEIKNF